MKDIIVAVLDGISALGSARLLLGAGLGAVIGALAFYFTPHLSVALKKDSDAGKTSIQQIGSGNTQNNYFNIPSAQADAKPNISFQKYALFWVETEPNLYYLGIVAKLFNLDSKAYLIKGITLSRARWQLVPRGGYIIKRYTEFADRAEIMEDNYIKPSSEGYFKKLLPIRIEMTVQGGAAPDFTLLNTWTIVLDSGEVPTTPNYYAAYEKFLTNAEWQELLKSRSPIKIDDLSYKRLP